MVWLSHHFTCPVGERRTYMDLHFHSCCSLDGEYSPARLATLCRKSGLKTAALTDHNSVRGVAEFREAAGELDISAVSGVEFDCTLDSLDLHLLGYGIQESSERFAEIETDILSQKKSSSAERMERLKDLGIMFDDEAVLKLSKDGIVVGEMIAEAALADERNTGNPLLLPYRPDGSRSDNPYVNFFWDFCSQGQPGFIPIVYMSFEEALDLIHSTGGFASIAHPGCTVKDREDLIAYMAGCGVEAMEVFSSYHTPSDVAYYRKLAGAYGLLPTTGSDFHGKTKPGVRLGSTVGMQTEDKERLQAFLSDFIR